MRKMQHKFLKTTVTIDGRKYWYRSTSRGNYEIYLSEAKHEGETALRFEGVKPVYLGSMRKATYGAGGRTHQIDDTWEFVLKVNGVFLDIDIYNKLSTRDFDGFTKSFVANAPTYRNKYFSAKDAFVRGIRVFDWKIAQVIRSSWDKVLNPITKEWVQPYDTSYVDPIGSPVVKVTDCIDSLRTVYGEDDALALAGQVLTVSKWNVDNPHRWPQERIFATISQKELMECTTKDDWRAGIRLYPHLFEVISGERTLSEGKEYTQVLACDICNDTDGTGYVDEALSFKVCKHCDVDGDNFNAKHWPSDVLLEIGHEGGDEVTGGFKMGMTYKNWPHANATCKVIAVSDDEVRVEIENTNGNIVRRWATVQERTHMNTVCITVDVEPFYTPVFNACDVVDPNDLRIEELEGMIRGLKEQIELLGWCRLLQSELDEAQEELDELNWGGDAE
jgi:hypothetical protein